MKRVVILVRRAPLAQSSTTEALRIALGMTLADHQVTVLYIDDGAGAAAELAPELAGGAPVAEALSLLGPCHVQELAEESSLKQARVRGVRSGVKIVDRAEALSVINGAELLISL
ncbi:MAG: DsrE family protein [Nitrospirota bacterium]